MGRCNFCTVKDVVRHADARNAEVYIVPRDPRLPPEGFAETFPDCVDVYVTPKDKLDLVWTAMLLRLPERCACDDDDNVDWDAQPYGAR